MKRQTASGKQLHVAKQKQKEKEEEKRKERRKKREEKARGEIPLSAGGGCAL